MIRSLDQVVMREGWFEQKNLRQRVLKELREVYLGGPDNASA